MHRNTGRRVPDQRSNERSAGPLNPPSSTNGRPVRRAGQPFVGRHRPSGREFRRDSIGTQYINPVQRGFGFNLFGLTGVDEGLVGDGQLEVFRHLEAR